MGKAPVGVAREAKRFGATVIAFCGCVGEGAVAVNEAGIDAFFPIARGPATLAEAMDVDNAYKNLYDTARQVLGLMRSLEDKARG